MGLSKTGPARITAAEREKQAVQMRIAGADYQAISEALNMSRSGAFKAVKRVLERTRAETNETAPELRQIEQRRLERLILSAMPQAQKGHLGAIDIVRKLSESLRKLQGLDEPQKTDITSGGKTISWKDFIDNTETDGE